MYDKLQIRAARNAPLPPLLIRRGYKLRHIRDGNYSVTPEGSSLPDDIVIKESYWISHQLQLSGNTIDFFTKIEGLPFYNAMDVIVKASTITPSGNITQSQPGNGRK